MSFFKTKDTLCLHTKGFQAKGFPFLHEIIPEGFPEFTGEMDLVSQLSGEADTEKIQRYPFQGCLTIVHVWECLIRKIQVDDTAQEFADLRTGDVNS